LQKQIASFSFFGGSNGKKGRKAQSSSSTFESAGVEGGKQHRGRMSEREGDAEFEEYDSSKIRHVTAQPSYILGQMRGYQVEGLSWLVGLNSVGASAILADEMGLGKTLQSVALLGLCFD
jgi:SWI/SNF-related matrix-associated actin-dependent regulator of chromatin subfamily A member 5